MDNFLAALVLMFLCHWILRHIGKGRSVRSMLNSPGAPRLWITAGVLVAAFVLLHTVSHGEAIVPHQPLRGLPYILGTWMGSEQPLSERIVQAVGVSDYANRIYQSPNGAAQLYVGYYANQRTGDTIHSPKNCLPGAGWDPIQSGYAKISVRAAAKLLSMNM